MSVCAVNKLDEFKEYLTDIKKFNNDFFLDEDALDEDEDAERFEDFNEIIEFAENCNIKIFDIWEVIGDGAEYYEVNFIYLKNKG